MIVQDVIRHIEEFAPAAYAEDFDNVGLLVGDRNAEVNGILITLDTLEIVVDEAIEKHCNLIVSFHPIIFSGIKKLTGANYVERVVMKAIRHNIAIYAIHTALDNAFEGVNAKICDILGLKNRRILIPQSDTIRKLITYVPEKDAAHLRTMLFNAGAGAVGNYDHCSFNLRGTGTFRANEAASPAVGEKGAVHYEDEIQLNVVFPGHRESAVVQALFAHHPYEEIAYEIIALKNTNPYIGMGMTGELAAPVDEMTFLQQVKSLMNVSCVRHSALVQKPVKKVAVLGGSGAFAISHAKSSGADVFITSDVKYHQFFQAENSMVIADIGHYETEQFTKALLFDHLTKKIPNFAPALPERAAGGIVLSAYNTNPVTYL